MARVLLGLGSNVGDKEANLRAAVRLLPQPLVASSLYRTEPVGYIEQDSFLNAVVSVETKLTPKELLDVILDVERRLGRVRTFRNAPRAIDIDILLWEDLVLHDEELEIPHPRLHERAFVLEPLSEIAPDAIHPLLHKSVAELRQALGASPGVERVRGPEWIAD
jgi:2-amino-4-hydroxy-6-hydroxymethyldihydropteridine diphosphokinase